MGAHQVEIGLAAAERDRGRDQDDVDDVVGGGCEHDARDHGADGLAVDGSNQRAGGESDKSEDGDVERDALEGPVLGELNNGRGR